MSPFPEEYLSRFPELAAFQERTRWLLRKRNLTQGQQLIRAGADLEGLFFLVEGRMRISMIAAEGNTVLLSVEEPLSVIGSVEVLASMPAISTVESMGSSVCLSLPAEAFAQSCQRDPALSMLIAKDLARKLVATSESSAAKNAPALARMAWYLLGSETDEVGLPSKADMASFLGISERHLNRHLARLQAKGSIEVHPGMIIIKRRRDLQSLADDVSGPAPSTAPSKP